MVLLVTLRGVSASAAEPETTGIAACDAFLAAYENCAASSAVPVAARPALLQTIGTMRTSFRGDGDGTSDAATRATLARQCLSMHARLRSQLAAALKCEFPPPSEAPPASGTEAEASASRPAPGSSVDAARQADAKASAYTEVHNGLVARRMRQLLIDHLTSNEHVLRPGSSLDANSSYQFGITDYDRSITALQRAMALPGSVPDADGAATRLLAALQTINPTIKALEHYQSTREFRQDDFKFAREMQPLLLVGMQAVISTLESFSTALFDRQLVADEALAATLDEISLARGAMEASLASRRLVRRYRTLNGKIGVDGFVASAQDVLASSHALLAVMDGLSPGPGPACADYAGDLDTLVNRSRDLVQDIRSGADTSRSASLFAAAYNRSITDLGTCRANEPRARPVQAWFTFER